jgi:hypothetical protein
MPILSWGSTANGNFPTQTVEVHYKNGAGALTKFITVVGMNTVYQFPA